MERANAAIMGNAGRKVRQKLKDAYGRPEVAEEAIREAMQNPRDIEQWATIVQKKQYAEDKAAAEAKGEIFYFVPNVDLRDDEEWTFEHIWPPLREQALATMAAAFLAWQFDQDERPMFSD